MNSRSELIAEAGRQISNPFLLCALISKRTRQLLITPNTGMNTAQAVNRAFDELIAGALEFGYQKLEAAQPAVPMDLRIDQAKDRLELPGGLAASAESILGDPL